jgi:NAD(P)-dependent dehydrogenase (short-subunit alcohol dehydrogenase family)
MPTIAIVGAGPGLGLSIAKVFGRHGFSVALISRTQEKLDGLAAELGESGIDAAGFAADVMDRPSIADAFARLRERFGGVDVLEYSPAPHNPVPGITMTGRWKRRMRTSSRSWSTTSTEGSPPPNKCFPR